MKQMELQKGQTMDEFVKYLSRKGKSNFSKATDEEMKQLEEWGKGKLPKEFLYVYQNMMPTGVLTIKDIRIYGMERIKAENFDYVPGANIYPLGLFTFASAMDGDAFCIDLNDETGSVYQCSHSLLSDENEIRVYGFGRTKNLEFTYENVIGCSMKIADNYREFTEVLRKRRSISYDVESYAADMYI